MSRVLKSVVWFLVLGAPGAKLASGERMDPLSCEERHPMNDAWWTGPMLANTAATAPRGHYLIEPYLYDVARQGIYDSHRKRQSAPHANGFGSLTYIVYGLTDKVGLGVIPTAGYNTETGKPSSAGPGLGDLTVQIQRRVTLFKPCRWVPTISAAVQEVIPTGKYDRLGNRPNDGFGAGTYTTNLEILSQTYFWLPNHRILRVRFNPSESFSSSAAIRDVSVYGTGAGFRGNAKPGKSLFVDLSSEYSLTRSWVLALDATYRNSDATLVTGYNLRSGGANPASAQTRLGSSYAFGLAPAVEYSWRSYIGVLLGVRLIPAGRNTSDTISPAVAINFVH